ncbi:ABC transporter substrate-binding protein [Zooshikella harenae]|uniref:ABC transporter substrate-binding protein n=1 Tax=Zooshikella harenae TaxID=2827238 RepID=A0ABS5ZG00_9GAMM|nr:ABC transporter substrate-binding protein [Zooshikella harenae]MBU2712698.1 ABC transporter substrate-binding protein [Zooshikella harenae]
MMYLQKGVNYLVIFLLFLAAHNVTAQQLQQSGWNNTVKKANKQVVYFNAWGGSHEVNRYIFWVGQQVKRQYGITLKHVKVDDISQVVSRLLIEKTAGRDTEGKIDLLWVNGENFATLKNNNLLYGPFTQTLPNYQWVDETKPSVIKDFSIPVEFMEAPWGMAHLVFFYDSSVLKQPPISMKALLDYAKQHPGRITYPNPPHFLGTTFLKQVLLELAPSPELLQKPVSEVNFAKVTAPLWAFLDELHPVSWREGKVFPANSSQMRQMLDSGELHVSFSFSPSEATNAIHAGLLPDTVKSYVHKGGTLGNTHFLAIPYNAKAKTAAQVVINFLLSAEAQSKKMDPVIWGDPTVLAIDRLPEDQQAMFARFEKLPGMLTLDQQGKPLPEPHFSWTDALEKAWLKRYQQ